MEQQLSLHLKNFNKRVQVMNQTNAKELVLSRLEAQNLHAELFELLAQLADLTEIKQENTAETINLSMDGGGF
jgi:hypothetical protein